MNRTSNQPRSPRVHESAVSSHVGRTLRVAGLVLLAHFLHAQAALADWPQWRGPARNGLVERSPALVNSLTGQSPLWQSEPIASGDNGGRGSLVVHAGRIYGLTSGEVDAQRFDEVFCLNAEDGTIIFRARLAEPFEHETGSSTPCIANERLYVVGSVGTVYCLHAETGEEVWSFKLPRGSHERIASSVAVVDGVAILLADILIGLDAETGDVKWKQPKVTGHESSPAVWAAEERDLLICNTMLQTYCLDPGSGEILWSVAGGGRSTPTIAQEYGGDFLVNLAGSRKNGLSAYRLTPSGPQSLWTIRVHDRAASPVVFDGHVYAIAGGNNGHRARILCVHLDTGSIAWEEVIDFAEVSSPVIADGKLVAVCGTFLWIGQATPERFTFLGQEDAQITLCTSPAIHNGRLYLRTAQTIVCYDLRRGI